MRLSLLAAAAALVCAGAAWSPAQAGHRGWYDPWCPPGVVVIPKPRTYYAPPYPIYAYPRVVQPYHFAVPPGHAHRRHYHYTPYPPPRGGATFYFRF